MSDVLHGQWERAFEEGRKMGREEGRQESFDQQVQYPHMMQLMLDIRHKAIRDCIAAVESLPPTTSVPVAHPHEGCPDPTIHMRWTPVVAVPDILTALRALQEEQ